MKKFLVLSVAVLYFSACQKQNTDLPDQISSAKAEKISVCHFDPITYSYLTIQVTEKSLTAHLAHGDLQGDCSGQVVKICDQIWTASNLNIATYRNGDVIPQVTDLAVWSTLTTGAWCYYNNDPANEAIYGKLYNWYAVKDPRGLAPSGWHVPSDGEWSTLANCLGGASVAGGAMKETGLMHWASPNFGATNSSGFNGLPGGTLNGNFNSMGTFGFCWSTTEINSAYSWGSFLYSGSSDLFRSFASNLSGFSVRVVKD